MTVHVILQRCGSSRVAFTSIPVQARVVEPGAHSSTAGDDLLMKVRPTDVESAKGIVQSLLDNRFGYPVTVVFHDRTAET